MQTFLPYASFAESAKVLDDKRLGKQRVETLQLVRAIAGFTSGWKNHPAAVMWRGHVHALIKYGLDMCFEWIERGYRDTTFDKLLVHSTLSFTELYLPTLPMPSWLGREDFHASHRANLLRKDRDFYSKFGWTEDSWLDYVWPGQG